MNTTGLICYPYNRKPLAPKNVDVMSGFTAIFSAVTAVSGGMLPWMAASRYHSPLHFATVRHTVMA